MKLYIKANSLKILKNIDTLFFYATSKTKELLDENSNIEYLANLKSCLKLQEQKEILFYDDKDLRLLLKGVYFGNSSCEHLLPNIREYLEAKEFCKKRHLNFIFAFPPISQKIEDVDFICKDISKDGLTQVVVNDFGVLNIALKYRLKPILGLNFTKIIKNAFLDSISQSDISKTQLNNQKELLSHIEFEDKGTREFYTNLNIRRFSVENVDIDFSFLDENPKMNLDFYYPFITISNSKACDIAGNFEDKRRYFVHSECSKYCNFASLEFKDSKTLGLFQRYNTIYKINYDLNIPKTVYKNPRNRVVWEIFG